MSPAQPIEYAGLPLLLIIYHAHKLTLSQQLATGSFCTMNHVKAPFCLLNA